MKCKLIIAAMLACAVGAHAMAQSRVPGRAEQGAAANTPVLPLDKTAPVPRTPSEARAFAATLAKGEVEIDPSETKAAEIIVNIAGGAGTVRVGNHSCKVSSGQMTATCKVYGKPGAPLKVVATPASGGSTFKMFQACSGQSSPCVFNWSAGPYVTVFFEGPPSGMGEIRFRYDDYHDYPATISASPNRSLTCDYVETDQFKAPMGLLRHVTCYGYWKTGTTVALSATLKVGFNNKPMGLSGACPGGASCNITITGDVSEVSLSSKY